MSIVNFFDNPPDRNRERVLVKCAEVHYFKCAPEVKGADRGCGIDISASNVRGTEIVCPNCGKAWSVVDISWSGRK